mgnify:CR=1
MKTETFKKPLAYYRELYTNQLLIDKMNKIKPIQDQEQTETKTNNIFDKIIKAFELVSLGLAWFVVGCSVWIVLTEFIRLFS